MTKNSGLAYHTVSRRDSADCPQEVASESLMEGESEKGIRLSHLPIFLVSGTWPPNCFLLPRPIRIELQNPDAAA